jgi:hypothetical protein
MALMTRATVDLQNEPLKSPIKLVKSKNSVGPF